MKNNIWMKALLLMLFEILLFGGVAIWFFNGLDKDVEKALDLHIGRDTVAYLNDGKFQIGKFGNKIPIFYMYDDDFVGITALLNNADKYKIKGNKMYVFSVDGCAVADGETNACRIYLTVPEEQLLYEKTDKPEITYLQSYEEFSDEERKIFDKMKQKIEK